MSIRKTVLAALLGATLAGPAVAAEGAWGEGTKASLRLLAAGVEPDGTLVAGLEVKMPTGWHTYWRSPGDAGIPPVFDFSGSENVADFEVAFPLPMRNDDGVSISNVYYDRVLLPLTAHAVDPAKPLTLSVAMDLGVCAEICVPDRASATLTVVPDENDAGARAEIAAAQAGVPAPAEPGQFAVTGVVRDGGTDKRPVFRFSAVVPDPADADILVEGPPHWTPYRPTVVNAPGGIEWTIKFSRLGSDTAAAEAFFRVTLISAGRAVDQTIAPQ